MPPALIVALVPVPTFSFTSLFAGFKASFAVLTPLFFTVFFLIFFSACTLFNRSAFAFIVFLRYSCLPATVAFSYGWDKFLAAKYD